MSATAGGIARLESRLFSAVLPMAVEIPWQVRAFSGNELFFFKRRPDRFLL
jgi:hypothetical protein